MSDIIALEETGRVKWSPEERKLLLSLKSKAVRDLTIGWFASAAAIYAASSRLKSKPFRVSLAGGVGLMGGLLCFGRSLYSSAEYLLSLDGSRIQKELANFIVERHPNDEGKMKVLTRHFYSERVYDDSNLDMPKLRLRYRNFFSDSNAQGDNRSGSCEEPHKASHNKLDRKSMGRLSNRASGISVTDVVEYPLDYLFGSSATTEEANYSNTPSTSPRKLTRSHKRSQRKQRRLLGEASSDS